MFAPRDEVRTAAFLAARDPRTVTGKNLALVTEESEEDPWTATIATIWESLWVREQVLPAVTHWWRCQYFAQLLEQR